MLYQDQARPPLGIPLLEKETGLPFRDGQYEKTECQGIAIVDGQPCLNVFTAAESDVEVRPQCLRSTRELFEI